MSLQPFSGNQTVTVEARTPEGALRFACSLFPALFTPTEPAGGKHFRSRASW